MLCLNFLWAGYLTDRVVLLAGLKQASISLPFNPAAVQANILQLAKLWYRAVLSAHTVDDKIQLFAVIITSAQKSVWADPAAEPSEEGSEQARRVQAESVPGFVCCSTLTEQNGETQGKFKFFLEVGLTNEETRIAVWFQSRRRNPDGNTPNFHTLVQKTCCVVPCRYFSSGFLPRLLWWRSSDSSRTFVVTRVCIHRKSCAVWPLTSRQINTLPQPT